MLSSAALAKAADKTMSTGSSRIAMDETITLPGQSPISMPGAGVIDPKARRGRLKFDLSNVPGQPDGIRSDTSQEVIFEGLTIYMRSPVLASSLPKGKRWLKIDLGKAGKAAGIDLGVLAQQGQDPTKSLDYLKAASGDVTRVGEEDVRGVKTTHYKATIDLRRYPDVVRAKDRASVRRSIEQIVKLSGTGKLPMEVWIGDDGVVRRMRQTIHTVVAPGTRGTIKQQFELFDFGTPVDVQLPPADEIQDNSGLVADGVRGLSG